MLYAKPLFPSLPVPHRPTTPYGKVRDASMRSPPHIDLLLQSLTPHTLLFCFVHRFYLILTDTITQRKDESRLAIAFFVGIIGLRGKRDTNVQINRFIFCSWLQATEFVFLVFVTHRYVPQLTDASTQLHFSTSSTNLDFA